jgi:hypothetical protein
MGSVEDGSDGVVAEGGGLTPREFLQKEIFWYTFTMANYETLGEGGLVGEYVYNAKRTTIEGIVSTAVQKNRSVHEADLDTFLRPNMPASALYEQAQAMLQEAEDRRHPLGYKVAEGIMKIPHLVRASLHKIRILQDPPKPFVGIPPDPETPHLLRLRELVTILRQRMTKKNEWATES